MMVLLHRLSRFWQIVPALHKQLAPHFWAEEEKRNRYRAQIVGIGGMLIMASFVVIDLIRWSDSNVVLTVSSLIQLLSNSVLAFNHRSPIKYLPIYPLYCVNLILAMVGSILASLILVSMLQLVIGFMLLAVAILLVPGFTGWFFVTVLTIAISYIVAAYMIMPESQSISSAQIYVIIFASPLLLSLLTRMGVKQRWDVFLKQHMIQKFNIQLQEQTVSLEETNELLEKRNEELDAFAHTVAHDLKNPLTVVVGYAEVARDEMVEEGEFRWMEYMNYVISAGRRGNMIIQELLLLAAVRKEDIELESIEMGVIVTQALERLSHHIDANQVELVQPTQWPKVVGYAGWVEEVWVNYISNAIKYGGRPCYVKLMAEVRPDGWVRFGVRDNGPGLSPEAQAVLFTEFTRLDKVRAQGHGLGLSIVRRIMEKLNGRVGIESTVGEGSTFYFELPIKA